MPDTATSNAAPTTSAPAATPAPPAAPDLSGLAQPGAAAPAAAPTQTLPASTVQQPEAPAVSAAPTTMAQIAPFEQNASAATQKATQLANAGPATAPPMKHARLLNMIQGLAVGLGAFGTAIATHGREGGAPEVQQFEEGQQEMKLRQQQAAQEQLSFKVQQQMSIADTNRQTAQNIILLSTLPTDLKLKDLQLTEAQQNVAMGKIAGANAQAEFMNTYGVSPEAFTAMMSGSTAPAPQDMENLRSFSQQKVTAASKILPANDPYVAQAQTVLSNPNATPQQIFSAVTGVQRQIGLQKQVTAAQSEQDTARKNSIVGQLSTPEALADPGAVAAIRAAIADPKTNPTDVPRLQALIPQAQKAQANQLTLARQKAQMEQDVQSGDPAVVGSEMALGLVAPSQVLSARSMSRPFYSKVLAAADAAAKAHGYPEIVENGKPTGHYFNLAQAEAQYTYAKNPQTQNTLNMITTLNEPGGDFDILKKAAADLPKYNEKTINSLFNASATEFGSPEATRYHAALYNLATLEAQVQKGGVPDQTQIQDVLDQFKASYSKNQLNAGLDIVRQDIGARGRAIVSKNPTLRAMYPELAEGATTATTAANDPFAQFGGKAR